MSPYHRLVEVPGGRAKTALLRQRIFEGAIHPEVRETSVRLVQMVGRNDHLERVARLHRFVRDSVDYHREPVEMFQAAAWTLHHGGDCDCLTILLGALAWSLRYPWQQEPHGDPDNPEHYSIWVGWPPSDVPWGEESTRWTHVESSAAAALGERSEAAAARQAVL